MVNMNNKNFCIYCKSEEVNDATFRYIDVIRGGLRDAGMHDLGITQEKNILRQSDFVVTISCLAAIRALAIHPRAEIIHWFQGIEAVERRFLHKGWRGWGRWVLWTLMERILLRRAKVKLFVSQQMRIFLGDKEQSSQVSLVIPCYNVDIGNITASEPERYHHINMVYAGSMYPWQCVEQSLEAYRAVRMYRPDATMTIFTREVERASEMCRRMGLTEVRVEAVSPTQLLERLNEFSYGFILRDAMVINEVSTPTKFSSYVGAGVIPIITKATPALVEMASLTAFKITTNTSKEYIEIAESVLQISESTPSPLDVATSYKAIFEMYFDDTSHKQAIKQAITALH